MIYVASLNIPAKHVFPKQVQQSNTKKIIENLKLDPKVTGMDTVILGPKDFIGVKGPALDAAIKTAHANICIIYLYQKDEDSDLAQTPYSMKYKKNKEGQAIRDAVEEFVGQHAILTGGKQVSSADFVTPDSDDIPDLGERRALDNVKPDEEESQWQPQTYIQEPVQQEEEPAEDREPVIKVPIPQPAPAPAPEPEPSEDAVQPTEDMDIDLPPIDIDAAVEEPKPLDTDTHAPNPLEEPAKPVPPVNSTVEEMLARINSYEDWSIFKENLKRDSIVKRLIEENSEYLGLIQMLDVLDKRIEAVWRDTALSPEQKFDKIKDIGLERSVTRAAENSINVEKVISIISTIVLSAKRTVDAKVASIDVSMYKMVTDHKLLEDTRYIDEAMEKRMKVQCELLELSRAILDLWKSIDNLVTDEIAELDRRLPSSNMFINDMVKPIGTQIFTPTNTAALVDKLMRALQENRIIASQLEESVNAVIAKLFELCESDAHIIDMQRNMINLLKANHVEDVVIVNSLLKNCLRVYTGADNSGRSATAITHSGVLSRSHNTLLVDLTSRAKFEDYGVTPMQLSDFMTDRVEEHFLCVESKTIPSPDELQEIVNVLKSRLNYYQYINVIVAPECTELLEQLSVDAKTVYYITNCSTSSLDVMKKTIANHKSSNIARQLVMIDAPVSPLTIADKLNIDPTITKLVCLPNIPMIRTCSLQKDRPYEYSDVARFFEEAFR